MKQKKDYNHYLNRFQEVVCFLTAVGIKKNFKTLDAYKAAKSSSKAYHLNISWEILSRLSRLAQGKKCFEAFLKSSESVFVYHRHCNKTYNSGKSFARNSWFELTDETLAVWFSDEKNFSTKTCELISASTHKWIDKYVFKYPTKKVEKPHKIKAVRNNTIEADIDDDVEIEDTNNIARQLQAFINEKVLSLSEAKELQKIAHEDYEVKEHRSGVTAAELNEHRGERKLVFEYFFQTYYKFLTDKQIEYLSKKIRFI